MTAFKLTKGEQADLEKQKDALSDAASALEDAIAVANESINTAVGKLNDVVTVYNAALTAVTETVEGVATRLREEFDEKSEGWQEGDRGQEAEGMINEWEGFSLDEVDEFTFEEFAFDASDGSEVDDLPTEAS